MSTAIEQSPAPVLTVADVVDRVRHRPRSFLLPVVLALVAAVAYVMLAPKTYVATASVQVQPVVSDQYGSVNIANVLNMATEQQVAQSASVTGLAAAALGTSTAAVQGALSVDTPQDTQVLNLRYAARTGGAAARGAQTVAEKYLEFRASSTKNDAQRRLDDLNQQIGVDTTKLAGGKAGAETGPLQGDLQSLLAQKRQLQAIVSTPGGRIITAASLPTGPSSPKATTDVPLGLAAGLVSGLALAVLLPAPHRQGTKASVGTTAPRRARDGSGKPSEFDQMLLAAQAKSKNRATFGSVAGPVTPPVTPPVPAAVTVAAGSNGNGTDSGNGPAANGVARDGAGSNGATVTGSAQSASRP